MLTCRECMEILHPDDPRVPVGRYHQSGCDYYCDKPHNLRELAQAEIVSPTEVIHRQADMGAKEFALLKDTSKKVSGLMKKAYKEPPSTTAKKSAPKATSYKGIK